MKADLLSNATLVQPRGEPAPQGSSGTRLWRWLDDRLGLSALSYPVPAHANTLPYTLGGITFVGFLILVLSGALLGQYYDPMPETARDSVLYIVRQAPLGDLIRGIHVWTASLVVITAFLHLVRVFATGAYKAPRELNWLVGVVLLMVTLGFVFTGTVLRWDQEAYEAMQHNMEVTELLGGLGAWFSAGFARSVPMLTRLYIAHVSILPIALVLLLIVHFFLVKHHGISPRPAEADAGLAPGGRLPKEAQTARYTTHLRKMFGYGLVLLALAGVLATVFPPAVGPVPNPSEEVTQPPFMFYWLYAFENWFGIKGILYAAVVFFGLLALVPALDRSPWRSLGRRRVMLVLGLGVLALLIALSLYVGFTPTAAHLGE